MNSSNGLRTAVPPRSPLKLYAFDLTTGQQETLADEQIGMEIGHLWVTAEGKIYLPVYEENAWKICTLQNGQWQTVFSFDSKYDAIDIADGVAAVNYGGEGGERPNALRKKISPGKRSMKAKCSRAVWANMLKNLTRSDTAALAAIRTIFITTFSLRMVEPALSGWIFRTG